MGSLVSKSVPANYQVSPVICQSGFFVDAILRVCGVLWRSYLPWLAAIFYSVPLLVVIAVRFPIFNLKGIRMKLPADLSAKLAPLLADAKKEATPFWHALRYCLIWLAWLISLPFSLLGAYLKLVAVAFKPELQDKPKS